jgi:hypothetical protein
VILEEASKILGAIQANESRSKEIYRAVRLLAVLDGRVEDESGDRGLYLFQKKIVQSAKT